MSPGDRVGGSGRPAAAGARPPPMGGWSRVREAEGQRPAALFPRSSGRDGARGAIFNVCGHRSLRSLGTRACGRPGSCWGSPVAGLLGPGPRGRTRARPVRKPVPLLWDCLPEASPWALPSRPGLVGADGAARSLDLSACCPCRPPCWTDGSVSWAPGTARPGEPPCPGHWPETAPSLSSILEA